MLGGASLEGLRSFVLPKGGAVGVGACSGGSGGVNALGKDSMKKAGGLVVVAIDASPGAS